MEKCKEKAGMLSKLRGIKWYLVYAGLLAVGIAITSSFWGSMGDSLKVWVAVTVVVTSLAFVEKLGNSAIRAVGKRLRPEGEAEGKLTVLPWYLVCVLVIFWASMASKFGTSSMLRAFSDNPQAAFYNTAATTLLGASLGLSVCGAKSWLKWVTALVCGCVSSAISVISTIATLNILV